MDENRSLRKMSLRDGTADILYKIRNEAISEKDRLVTGISNLIDSTGSLAKQGYNDVLDFVETRLDAAGKVVEADVGKVTRFLDKVKNEIQSTAENTIHSFIADGEKVVTDIRSSISDALGEVERGTNYIRNEAVVDWRNLKSDIKTEYARIKADFMQGISDMTVGLYEKTKSGVESLVADAKAEVSDINALRKQIDSDIEAKLVEIQSMLEDAKTAATKELDKIVHLIRTEIGRLEAGAVSVKNTVDKMATNLVLSALFVTPIICFLIIFSKQPKSPNAIPERRNDPPPSDSRYSAFGRGSFSDNSSSTKVSRRR